LLSNALNLADGINGLASGIATIWMFIITLYTSSHYSNIYFLISILMFANTYFIYRGKYFLGDSGSLFFGSAISLLLIFNYNEIISQKTIPLETIFIFFMVPGVDMLRLFLFRIAKKKHPFARDLNHLHHYLLKVLKLPKVLIIYFSLISLSIFLDYFFSGISLYIICVYMLIYVTFIFYIKNKKYL
jgi:UDP-GlcNAc:undecaprenyl-phosphate GlcNAc-1-phosphate transferase